MRSSIHPRLALLEGLADGLAYAAQATLKKARKAYREPKRISRGGTVRPGPDTPLWNELAEEARGLIRHRGEKTNLARFLGVPRQRVHQYLMDKSAGPDAERTLLLLAWVHARRSGIALPLPTATYLKK
jgi:hypothetical protein